MHNRAANLPVSKGLDPVPSDSENRFARLPILHTKNLTISYHGKAAISNVSLTLAKHKVTTLIGPSGCGKSTLLRQFNRTNDFIAGHTMTGEVLFRGVDLYNPGTNPVQVRKRIGMVFQKPNPFRESVFDNIAWGLQLHQQSKNVDVHNAVEHALRQANLWGEVSDRLSDSALSLSGGQQQRLCIARALAMQPDVILMDEPCSALDPVATAAIEELIVGLKSEITIILVTHNLQQAMRVGDQTAFLYEGELVEFGETNQVLNEPQDGRTRDFLNVAKKLSPTM